MASQAPSPSSPPNSEQKETLTYDPPPNDPSKTKYDPNSPISNYVASRTNRMTPLGLSLFIHNQHLASEEADCQRCESQVSYLFRYSPTILFLRQKINELNGDIDESKVFCRRCPIVWTKNGEGRLPGSSAGVHMDHGIQVCANFVRERSHLEEVLGHEMVHIWDHLRWKVEEGNLRHAACTEIRASALSGECRWAKEFFQRHNLKIMQTHQDCVRKRAILSVTGRPFCENDVQATKAVNDVWDSCYNDTRPFEEIYR